MFHKVSPIFLILFTQLSFLEVFYFIFSRKFLFIVAEIWRKIHEFRILRKKENLRSFREPFFVALASLSISKVAQHTTAQRGEESILNLSFNLVLGVIIVIKGNWRIKLLIGKVRVGWGGGSWRTYRTEGGGGAINTLPSSCSSYQMVQKDIYGLCACASRAFL